MPYSSRIVVDDREQHAVTGGEHGHQPAEREEHQARGRWRRWILERPIAPTCVQPHAPQSTEDLAGSRSEFGSAGGDEAGVVHARQAGCVGIARTVTPHGPAPCGSIDPDQVLPSRCSNSTVSWVSSNDPSGSRGPWTHCTISSAGSRSPGSSSATMSRASPDVGVASASTSVASHTCTLAHAAATRAFQSASSRAPAPPSAVRASGRRCRRLVERGHVVAHHPAGGDVPTRAWPSCSPRVRSNDGGCRRRPGRSTSARSGSRSRRTSRSPRGDRAACRRRRGRTTGCRTRSCRRSSRPTTRRGSSS